MVLYGWKRTHTIEFWMVFNMELMGWIRFCIWRQRVMMKVVMLCSVVEMLEGARAARVSAGKVIEHWRNSHRMGENVLKMDPLQQDPGVLPQ